MIRSIRTAALAALVLVPSSALAQSSDAEVPGNQVLAGRTFQPPTAGGTITLAEAVRQTLLNSPSVIFEAHEVDNARGRVQEARGAFDTNFFATAPSVTFIKEPILPALRTREIDKRRLLSIVADAFTEIYRSMRTITENTSTDPPPCPSGINFEFPFQSLDRTRPEELKLLGTQRELLSPTLVDIDLQISGIDLSQICSRDISGGIGGEILKEYWRQIDFSGGLGINGILTSAAQIRRESFRHLTEITESIGARIRLNLERLGPVPDTQLRREFTFETAIGRALRNGISIDALLRLHSTDQGFGDKILDPIYGGLDLAPSFPSEASLSMTFPLGKGRGTVAVTAQERAAVSAANAQQERVRHAASTETFRTVIAYLTLGGAQQTLALLEESLARQQTLAKLTDQGVAAGDLARVDADRVRARMASVATTMYRARLNLVVARLALAESMGSGVTRLEDAPTASQGFSEALAQSEQPIDAGAVLARRHDSLALNHVVDGSAALTAAARSELKRRFDLSLSGGMSNRYESPLHRFLPDELDPIYSDFTPRPDRDTPTRYFEPRGFSRSLTGRWEPFVAASITIDFPFANNAAKGRLAQSEGGERQSRVQSADLQRTIGDNIVSVRGELQRIADSVRQFEMAVASSEAALQGDLQRLMAGEVTVFNTLLTEEQLTADKLELLRQRQLYLSTLARLKFETGEMITFVNEGTSAESLRFSGGDYVGR